MLNYKELGLRIGLEIHREMNTHKLFCQCPSILSDETDFEIKRRLHSVKSELGEEDIVAKYEMNKNKYAIYKCNKKLACLVETDEEPPHEVNKEALITALITSKLLNCKIIDEIQFMRKQVLDLSNTSGFQRTGLISIKGFIETSKGRVNIETVCLEEDSARKIKNEEDYVIYNLDRLGIPLIEIATDSSIKDPEHAKEVAEYLGMVLKSTGRFKSGIGSIRQDVNVSIKGHPRVELKGFKDLRRIPKTVDNEIHRQLENLKSKREIKSEVRKVEPDFSSTYLRPMPTGSRMYPETDIPPVKITKELLSEIKIPELITEKAVNIEKKYNLNPVLAREILKLNIPFDYYAEKYSINPNLIAEVLIEIPKELKSRFNVDPKKISGKDFEFVFEHLESKAINREAVKDILLDIAQGKHIDLNKYKHLDTKEIENKLKEIIAKNKGASFSALMGEAMKEFKGKVSGKQISDLLNKLLK